tara:strand:- start:1317 stop:1949 length:633 start_codon:yes stop_codon:yes gene_type:complete
MTGNDMITSMGLRLEDPAKSVFTESAILDALNIAQKTVAGMVNRHYLVELQTIAENKTVTSGKCTFDTAFGSNVNPLGNGITGVYDESNDVWCTMIEPSDVKVLENSYLSGDTTSPVAYVFADSIYIKPTTTTLIDIWYIKSPTDLTASSVECELNIALQEIVLNFAEAQLWRSDAKESRATSAYQSAVNMVQTLNEKYAVEPAIGTKGR